VSESYKPPCTAKATTEDYIALVSENARLIAAVKESAKRWSQEFRMREAAERELVLSEDARVFASNGWKAAERELAVMRTDNANMYCAANWLSNEIAGWPEAEMRALGGNTNYHCLINAWKAVRRIISIDRARAEQGQPATEKGAEHAE